MANEDLTRKDIISELKNMESENDQSNLEPINVIIGRFTPFTIGHLSMAKELKKINDLDSVYIYIRSKSGKNSKFSDRLVTNYMTDVVQKQDLVRDAWSMTASFIPIIIKETQRRGYNPILIGAGEDRAKSYENMAKRMKDIQVDPEFKIQELKGRITSATEVRQAIMDDDKKKFMKLTPKEIHPYYKQLQDELEKLNTMIESISVVDIMDGIDLTVEEVESILESNDEDFFSHPIIVESILEQEIENKKNEMKLNEKEESVLLVMPSTLTDLKNFKKWLDNSDFYAEDYGDYFVFQEENIDSLEKTIEKELSKKKISVRYEIQESFKEIIESVKLSSDAKKFIKGMQKIKLDKDFAKSWMPGHKYIYTDGTKYYFIDSDGDTMELKNTETLKHLKKTFENVNEDLFENPEFLPKKVQDLIYDMGDGTYDYRDLRKLQKKLEKLGYTFDYGLDAQPYDLRKIDENLEDIDLEKIVEITKLSMSVAHTSVFEKALQFRKCEITYEDLQDKTETNVVSFLAKFNESKLLDFKNYITEMTVSPEYGAKIDNALLLLVNSNKPIVWEDFKSYMIRTEFFKKEFKPFLMMQGLSDYQIDRFVENILRVKYQHYTNYFKGTISLEYTK